MSKDATFADAVVEAIRNAKILGVRAGTEHRYTGVWVVVVDGRVFVRSWNDKPTGWFRAFRKQPSGTLQVVGLEVSVRAKLVRGTNLTQTSVNRELEILSKIFTKAKDFGKVDRNPCRQVERFKKRKVIPRYFTHDEEERLMTKLTGTLAHLRPIIIVGIGTGLRPPSEIFNLRRSDVDFERNVLRAGTKTDEEREIPMSKDVREVLLELYNKNTESEFLFVSWRTKDRFKEVKNGFRRALKDAGIKGAKLYTMRHTFGTRLGEAGYSSDDIMPLMGHRDIKTSAGYVHGTDGRKQSAVEAIQKLRPVKNPALEEKPESRPGVSP